MEKDAPKPRKTLGNLPIERRCHTMKIHIHVESMKAAEQLSNICKRFTDEVLLRSEKFCIDPKSTLGILAMMYSARDTMFIDTNDMEDEKIPELISAIEHYIVKE